MTADPGFIPDKRSLTARALRLALLRIGLVSLCAGAASYYINMRSIEEAVTRQLLLSTEQTLQRESLPFREIRTLQQNFLDEFQGVYTRAGMAAGLVRDFDLIFHRHEDGSYTCLLYTSPSPRDRQKSRMPSSA